MQLGDFECLEVIEGYFRLDGGAMFGSVPKTMWDKVAPPDAENRILLALRTLLIRTGERNILVDTGIGHKWNEKLAAIFCIDHSQHDIHKGLQKHGLAVEDITDVILTHFHFDHAGGATYYDNHGNLKLTFPNAHWYVHRANVELSKKPNPKDKASYLPENILPVLESGKVTILEGGDGVTQPVDILPGIEGIVSYGHTTGMMMPRVKSKGESLVYLADLIPTHVHIPNAWVMGYDLYALTTMEEKQQLLSQAQRDNTILYFEHDPDFPACHLAVDDKARHSAGPKVAI